MLRRIFCFKGFDAFFTKAAFCTLHSSVILKTLKEKKNMKKERKQNHEKVHCNSSGNRLRCRIAADRLRQYQ